MTIDKNALPIRILQISRYAQLALQEYEGIGRSVGQIDNAGGFFFGFNQKVMLDFTVLQICKLYDKTKKKYIKNTVFTLFDYLEENKEKLDFELIDPKYNSGIRDSLLMKSNEASVETVADFINVSRKQAQELVEQNHYDSLLTYRDKHIAHAERIEPYPSSWSLPSIEVLEHYINFAIEISIWGHRLFGKDSSISLDPASMKVATMNIINKLCKAAS